jgi:hypothetical protein
MGLGAFPFWEGSVWELGSTPPVFLYGYQRKELARKAMRMVLILKGRCSQDRKMGRRGTRLDQWQLEDC